MIIPCVCILFAEKEIELVTDTGGSDEPISVITEKPQNGLFSSRDPQVEINYVLKLLDQVIFQKLI